MIQFLKETSKRLLLHKLSFLSFAFLFFSNFTLLIVFSPEAVSQDIPRTAYGVYSLANDNQSNAMIELLKLELKNTEVGSLREAYYANQLSYFYRGAYKKDSSQLYKNIAKNYWLGREINEANADYYGQF